MHSLNNINQSVLWDNFQIPPSRANAQIVGPLTSSTTVGSRLRMMGITALDLKPIDWRKEVYLSPVLNQQDCGDCWAMSSTSALVDRFIVGKNIKDPKFSPEVTAQCASQRIDQGCGGGLPFLAGQFFEKTGVPTSEGDCPSWERICPGKPCKLPSCQELSALCSNDTVYKAIAGSTENLTATKNGGIDIESTIFNLKRELQTGPVVATFFVPKDFFAPQIGYKWDRTKGIYINGEYGDDLEKTVPDSIKQKLGVTRPEQWGDIMIENGSPAGHAVCIVGWGTENIGGDYGKVQYWIVRNSWGPEWNEGGYCRIAMNDGSGHNTLIGFDIPVSKIVMFSTGQTMNMAGLFGGCVSFQADLSTGPKGEAKRTKPGSKSKSEHDSLKFILWIGLLVLGLIILYYLWKKYKGKSKGIYKTSETNYRPTTRVSNRPKSQKRKKRN